MATYILGISAFYHDSAACILRDGELIGAAQEERFTRKKHDFNYPAKAVEYCLDHAGIGSKDLEVVAFYDKPLLKFERLLETYFAFAPRGFTSFLNAMPIWTRQKLFLADTIKKSLDHKEAKLIFPEHHESHAASAFFPSPYEEAATLTTDGVGEWTTTSFGVGSGKRVQLHGEIRFPHSLGMLYSAFTYYTGFRVNSGEYKVMGLAPYGEPKYVDTILDNIIDVRDDGSFHLNMDYFDYCTGMKMTNNKFADLFGGPAREPESELTQREMDLAASVQVVTEHVMLKMARHVREATGQRNLCMAGGVALNCVANGKILREKIFDDIWIQPAAGDAGGAVGAAYLAWHHYLDQGRPTRTFSPKSAGDRQAGSYLGPEFSDSEIEAFFDKVGAKYTRLDDDELAERAADILANENVIGWFQGRMEFGPRALGNRSIIGDARSREMQSTMNLKIKFRESFRPFAPSVLEERVEDYFEIDRPSPYMLLVANVKEDQRIPLPEGTEKLFGIDKLRINRSKIPSITHVDYSARIQTVSKSTNPRYHDLISKFFVKTGCPVVINTSFNVRGEPIVCTPRDAYTCFMRTEMDFLVVNNYILDKKDQPEPADDIDWKSEFVLD